MNPTLLDQFLAEECTPAVRDLVRSCLDSGRSSAGQLRKRLEFNRFEVSFDIREGDVVIEDVLDATAAGVQRISIAEFLTALAEHPPL